MNSVGVDGCRFGWIAVSKLEGNLSYRLSPNIAELLDAFSDAESIFIDIPIGLPWRATPIRPCDALARDHLRVRRSSVFPVPCRAAVFARSVERARALNIAELGRSLSQQTWDICPKIAEVDTLLTSQRPRHPELREIHPEICFWGLAGGSPMKYNKKQREGVAERIALLRRFERHTERLLGDLLDAELRRDVGADDLLDALVAYVTASRAGLGLQSLCSTDKHDEMGLPMEMVYVQP